uniref:Uncharacterized protein n=2 Tax=Kalanchoe fedtschenkoi TaxID=63787 RepID=A0A7N0RI59_KALFE
MDEVAVRKTNKMFKLSCFHYQKPKKGHSFVAVKMQAQEANLPSTINPSLMVANEKVLISRRTKLEKSCSLIERDRSSDEFEANLTLVHEAGVKKSKSLGCVLLEESGASGSNNETETEETHDSNGLTGHDDKEDEVARYSDQHPESVQVGSKRANDASIFPVGGPEHLGEDGHTSSLTAQSDEPVKEGTSDRTARAMPVIVKSRSSPNIARHSPPGKPARSRSSLDLHVLDMRRKENSSHDVVDKHLGRDEDRDDGMRKNEADIYEITAEDGYDSYRHVAAKDWIMPVIEAGEKGQNAESSRSWGKVPREDFKTKRIEEWVMGLQHCGGPQEEEDRTPDSNEPLKRVTNGLTAVKLDAKVTPGMEDAKKYISALTPTSNAAHLENHGLVVIPFLSAFVGLKVLNLSGNAIVRITAGALPRGLHVLNLSKNHITTIEGLRELTRLRVLDLSYNRIFRIGHGLASCSSLKELYLAGNKISEVEGLHRLLKLNVIDLRFNKLSTTKSLGQLAANYHTLQAISLEGNPAQKNVGDDQVKKYLQGLLPNLAYCNRQPIKSSSLKEAADRSFRLGISDRSLHSRKTAAQKTVTITSSHGRKTPAVVPAKVSRGRQGPLPPPSGAKA